MQKDYTKIDEEFDLNFTDDNWCSCGGEYENSGARRKVKDFLHTQISLSEQSLLKALKLLEFARCPDQDCDNNGTVACRISDDEWEPQQCQWCDERKTLLTSLKHLPQEEVKNK